MANEILVLDRSLVIFLIVFPRPPLEIDGRAQVITQASGVLPELAAFKVGPAGLDLIDAGRVAWESIPIEQGKKEPVAHLRWRVNEKYRQWAAAMNAEIAARAAEIAAARFIDFVDDLPEPPQRAAAPARGGE